MNSLFNFNGSITLVCTIYSFIGLENKEKPHLYLEFIYSNIQYEFCEDGVSNKRLSFMFMDGALSNLV